MIASSSSMLLQRRIEGLIAIANYLYIEVDLLDAIQQRKIPCVIIGREFETKPTNWVAIDNEGGTYAAMNHLYALGHRRFAFIKGPRTVVDSALRWAGICRFADEFELEIDPELVVELHQQGSSYDGGCSATVQLLERQRPFTALVTFDDITAFGAICALRSAGRSVPEDCSVVGFDDVPAAAVYNPSLTTIRQPMERLGSMGIELLINSINVLRKSGTFVHEQRKVSPELVVRESSTPPG